MKVNLEFMKSVFEQSIDLSKEDTMKLNLDSQFEKVPGWDSLGHMRIILELESRLDVEFDIEEVIGVDTIEKLIGMCEKK